MLDFEFEPLYDVLKKVESHPELIIKIQSPYKNVVRIFIPDDTEVEHADFYFPSNKLMVNRLPNEFIKSRQNLFADYWEATGKNRPDFDEVWATTAHLNRENAFLIELSFE